MVGLWSWVWCCGCGLLSLSGLRLGAATNDAISFSPPIRPAIPTARDSAWVRTPIDAFVLARLEAAGLRPSSEAPRATWLRRVSLDLTGLPPTPEDTRDFLNDSRADAFERVVDRLLGSPRYGERWAQHWLDVVRYADTHGFEVNTERPTAWPYRDWVIGALNRDLPVDRFVREQIAGDSLGSDAATGFLVTASVLLPGQIGADDVSKRLARQDALDEIVVNTSQTFLGLSIGCARCHDHKFDPILSREYYSLQAFFAGVEYDERELRTPETAEAEREIARMRREVSKVESELARFEPVARPAAQAVSQAQSQSQSPRDSDSLRPAVNAVRNSDRFVAVTTRRVRFTILDSGSMEPCLDELEVFTTDGRNVALASTGTRASSTGDTVVPGRHTLAGLIDGQYGNEHSWMAKESGHGVVTLEFLRPELIERVVWGRDREGMFADRLALKYRIEVEDPAAVWRTVADASDRRAFKDGDRKARSAEIPLAGLSASDARRVVSLGQRRKELEAGIQSLSASRRAFAGAFRAPDSIRRLRRGDPEQPLEPVVPAIPAVLGPLELPESTPESKRRLVLADWLARPDHPLVSRVMVNRIWQGHFGTGLVETPSDFGRNGARPSHPELLDWLATELVRNGGSLKQLHRLIVLSAAYRQSSSDRSRVAAGLRVDASDRLLWRYPSRRLESEGIRDSMLWVSGRLDLKSGGRGFDLFNQRGGLSGFKPVESFSGDGLRRMVFAHKVRREREAVFGAFDCPDAGQSTARRRESTTPLQALNLFNSRFTLEESEALARRVTSIAGPNPAEQVRIAYQLAFSRAPDRDESTEGVQFVRKHGLPGLCRALYNSNEFLMIP